MVDVFGKRTRCKGWGSELGKITQHSASCAHALGGDSARSGTQRPHVQNRRDFMLLRLYRYTMRVFYTPACLGCSNAASLTQATKRTDPNIVVGITSKNNIGGLLKWHLCMHGCIH
jgi:hypothetical protein